MEKSTKQRINEIAFNQCGSYGSIKSADDIKPEHLIFEHLGADSLDTVEIAFELEEEFEIEIPDEAYETWQTMHDVYTYFEGIDYTKG